MSDSLQNFRARALFECDGPIRVVPWPDPVADASGFAAASAMVEWTGTEVRFVGVTFPVPRLPGRPMRRRSPRCQQREAQRDRVPTLRGLRLS